MLMTNLSEVDFCSSTLKFRHLKGETITVLLQDIRYYELLN